MKIEELTAAHRMLGYICDLIENSNGILVDSQGQPTGLAGDEEWLDMADAYVRACHLLGRKADVKTVDGEEWEGEILVVPENPVFQFATITERNNVKPCLEVFVSLTPVSFERACQFCETSRDFDWNSDGITSTTEIKVFDLDAAITPTTEENGDS